MDYTLLVYRVLCLDATYIPYLETWMACTLHGALDGAMAFH
jgi:hypothetical protein